MRFRSPWLWLGLLTGACLVIFHKLGGRLTWPQSADYDADMCLEPVVAARKVGPKIERHPWLLQSIDEYEHMDFSWERRCGNIDWDVYAAELHERVSAGFQHHNPIDRFNFILTSSAHTNHPLIKSNDIMVPMANHLPSTLYRCALEAAVTVNPAHKTVMFARTLNEEQFIKAELEKNPAFKVLLGLPNFEIVPIASDRQYFAEYLNRTGISAPLDFLDEGIWRTDSFLSSHLSDLYRHILMHEHGGVYADMDSIGVQDMRRYPSGQTWLVSDLHTVPKGPMEGQLVSGIFGDVPRGILTKLALEKFRLRYDPKSWVCVGPGLITEAAQTVVNNSLGYIDIYKTWDFMPIHWSRAEQLANRWAYLSEDQLYAVAHSNQVHVYGGMSLFKHSSLDDSDRPPPDSVLGVVMANRCPLTYCEPPAKWPRQ